MSYEALLYRMTAVACGVGGLAGLLLWARPAASWARPTRRALGVTLPLLSLGAWVARLVDAGHLPLFGTYESALSLAVAVLWTAAAFDAVTGRGVLAAGSLVSGALLAHGLGFDPTAYALTISERSLVVDLHAVLAWLAFGALAANAAFACREVLPAGVAPTDRWLTRSLEIGFVLHSAMMASGSLYKFMLFGKTWSFDPIETMGFVVWVSYGTLLHLHLLGGWRGRRLAAWTLAVFVLLVISYRCIVYFPSWSTYHIFDMDLRTHVRG